MLGANARRDESVNGVHNKDWDCHVLYAAVVPVRRIDLQDIIAALRRTSYVARSGWSSYPLPLCRYGKRA